MSTLKGNKQAICAFKLLLDTLDDSDENHWPDDDQLLFPADAVKIATIVNEMNGAKKPLQELASLATPIQICSTPPTPTNPIS